MLDPDLVPLEPDTILNCLPAFVTVDEPVNVTESSVRCNVIEAYVKVRFKEPGFKLCL